MNLEMSRENLYQSLDEQIVYHFLLLVKGSNDKIRTAEWYLLTSKLRRCNRGIPGAECYRKLIALRNSSDVIKYGDFELLLPNHSQLFAYRRSSKEKSIIVCGNFSDCTVQLPKSLAGEVVINLGVDNYVMKPFGAIVLRENL